MNPESAHHDGLLHTPHSSKKRASHSSHDTRQEEDDPTHHGKVHRTADSGDQNTLATSGSSKKASKSSSASKHEKSANGSLSSNSLKRNSKGAQTVITIPAITDMDIVPGNGIVLRQKLPSGSNSRPPSYLTQEVIDLEKSKTQGDEDWKEIDKESTSSALHAHSQINFSEYTAPDLDQSMRSIYSNLSYLVQTLQPKGWKWPESKTRFEFLSRCNFREFSKSIFITQYRMRTEYKEQSQQISHIKELMAEAYFLETGKKIEGPGAVAAFEELVRSRK